MCVCVCEASVLLDLDASPTCLSNALALREVGGVAEGSAGIIVWWWLWWRRCGDRWSRDQVRRLTSGVLLAGGSGRTGSNGGGLYVEAERSNGRQVGRAGITDHN